MDYQKFIQAAQQLEQAAAARRHSLSQALEQEVADALARNDHAHARLSIEAFLERQPHAAKWWHELALLRHRHGDGNDAQAAWRHALASKPQDATLLHEIGRGLAAAGCDPVAIGESVWNSPQTGIPDPASNRSSLQSPELQEAWLAILGNDWPRALPALANAMQAQPGDRQARRNLACALEHIGQPGQARCVHALHLLARGDMQMAVEAFEAAPTQDARSSMFLGDYLRALRYAGQEERAIEVAEGMPPESVSAAARTEWADALVDLGLDDKAIAVLQQGSELLDDPGLALQADLLLPAVPASQDAMEQSHQRVRRNMRALATRPLPSDPGNLDTLARSLRPSFLLAYMGDACVEEARAHGRYAERVMQARFPRFSTHLPSRSREAGEPVRIGCATSFVNHHVVMKCFAGWLQRPDRGAFEIHLFPLATERNAVTDYLARLVDRFHPPVTDTGDAAQQIRSADLDLLLYPEIGLDGLSFRLAAMRLAPVQCVAGGHPMTTGLSTIDYFLSAAAAEPADAAGHYSERLATMPGMGICMPPIAPPANGRTRADFGLADDQVVYLSTQNLFKYLPAHDDLYARIAENVENALFLFVEGSYPAWTRAFTRRLRSAFASRGLDLDRHVRFVPRQDYGSYLSLNAVSDVFLDPPGGFSGGMTVRDALACNLPVVTLPGSLMRNRQGAGLLTELGINHTIATDLDDYVSLAVRLGWTPDWRSEIVRLIQERRQRLFNDTDCLRALEGFLRKASDASPGSRAR